MTQQLTDETFASAINDGGLVVVDFGAAWCGPCRALAPQYEALSEAYEGKAKFYKVDIDEAQETAANLGIMSVPTVLFFKGGQIAQKSIGLKSKEQLAQIVEGLL